MAAQRPVPAPAPWWAESLDTGTTRVVESAGRPRLPAGVTGFIQGPFATKAEAQAFLGTGAPAPGTSTSEGGPGNAIGNPLTGIRAVGDFFSRLSEPNTWIRIGEVVIGLVLIGIGVNSMLKGKPLSIVTSAAGKAGKAAMLA